MFAFPPTDNERSLVVQIYATLSNPWLLSVDSSISKTDQLNDNLTVEFKPRGSRRGVSALRVNQRTPSLLCVDNVYSIWIYAGA